MKAKKKLDAVLWILFAATLASLLFSCKSTNTDCDAYAYVVEKDTVTIVTEHVNYDTQCSESATIETVITDTIYLQTHEVQFN
jgi:hypothetical protein